MYAKFDVNSRKCPEFWNTPRFGSCYLLTFAATFAKCDVQSLISRMLVQKPQYNTCVAIVTKAALKEMTKPAILALATPVVVGLVFKYVGIMQVTLFGQADSPL